MSKASKRKKRGFENRDVKESEFGEVVLPSTFTKYSFLITLFLITITAFLIYSNTFSSPFHFDDTPNIVENYKLRDFSNFWPPSGTRYIGFLSFAINYYFGGLNVFGYHLVNIVIHIINSILVWWLVILTFKTPVMEKINSQLKYFIALTASLIFVSHPIQTQAVTYIVQRFASLSTLFYLLSLALYIKVRIGSGVWEVVGGKRFSHILHPTFYILSVLSAILAMKTKEIGFTLPFVVVLYEFMFFTPHPSLPRKGGGIEGGAIASPSLSSLRGQSPKQSHPLRQGFIVTKRLLYLSPFLLTLLIIPLSLIGTDKPVGDMIGELREAAQETEEILRNIYLLTQFRVIVTYIRLLFLPINQNLDYDYPLSHSLFEPATFLSFLFLLSTFALAVYLFIRSRKTDNVHGLLASFGILWFFITLSVESSIIPIRDVIFEHRLYLPSVGAVIAFSSGVIYGMSYAKEKLFIKVSLTLATCILILVTAFPLGVATYKRNFVWRDDITLWEDVVGKSKKKARGYNNLGKALQDKELFTESVKALQQAIQLKPNLPEPHINLGNLYSKQGRFDYAIKEYLTALKLNPYDAEAHNNLGNTYYGQGLLNEAMQEYMMALKFKPDYPDAYSNLGSIYAMQKQVGAAIEEFKKALRLQPDMTEAHNNLGNAYSEQGSINEAIKEYKIALKLKPNYAKAHYNLGLVYKGRGLKSEALREFEEALKIQQNYTEARKMLESLSKYGN